KRFAFFLLTFKFGWLRNGMNLPSVNSFASDATRSLRNKLFGDITTNGLASSRPFICAWRRNKWKNCADDVTFATIQLCSPAICKKRSKRALECSGPCPSYPCGNNITRFDLSPHFARDEEIN